MKPLFKMYAIYNKAVNEKMMQILEILSEEQIRQDLKTFHPSILETFLHIIKSDLLWLDRFQKAFPDYACFSNKEIISNLRKELNASKSGSYKDIFNTRKKADLLIEQFILEIPDNEFEKNITYTNTAGEKFDKILFQCLNHLFVHGIHHRGQIAGMLDILGVKNDFSGFLSYF